MKSNLKLLLISLVCLFQINSGIAQIPFLKNNEFNATQLIVHGKPFLMLTGEANNSSGSGIAHMEKTMKSLKDANLNSMLVSVSWEIIEPKEGVFDKLESVGIYDWYGAFYTRFWIDPKEDLIDKFRNLVYQSISD